MIKFYAKKGKNCSDNKTWTSYFSYFFLSSFNKLSRAISQTVCRHRAAEFPVPFSLPQSSAPSWSLKAQQESTGLAA
jgi:hypothetical protein